MTDTPRRLVVDLAATSKNWALTAAGEARLRAGAPAGWEFVAVRAPTSSDGDGPQGASREALAAIEGAEAYFGFGITADLVAAGRRLRWVHSAAAGSATSSSRGSPTPTSCSPTRRGSTPSRWRSSSSAACCTFSADWTSPSTSSGEASGAKRSSSPTTRPCASWAIVGVLIVGTGGIGQATAVRMAAFGGKCVGVRRGRSRAPPAGFERVVGSDQLDEELSHADVLVLAAPLTGRTARLMTHERLERLPPGAIVVNVARGALMDEEAIADLREAGRLRGAVLDVFQGGAVEAG